MRLAKCLSGLAIVAASLAIAVPAGAHTAAVTGVSSCSDGSHLVTWTITNNLAKKAMGVSATAAASGVAYDVSVVTNPIAGGGSTKATTVVPGGVTGSITITVVATWTDEFTRTITATVALPVKCATTTTSGPSTTTTTTTTTTTSVSSTTSSTPGSVLGVSSVPTTAPGKVAAVQCGPTTLACTGSSDTGSEVTVGLGMLAAGAGLLALRRRPSRIR